MFGGRALRAVIVETIVGLLAYGEDGARVAEEMYPRDPKQIASVMAEHRGGGVSKPLASLVERLVSMGYDAFASPSQALMESVAERFHVATESLEGPSPEADVAGLAMSHGFIQSEAEIGAISHAVSTALANMDIHRALSSRESLLSPTVQLLGDMDTVINGLSGRMREWYGVHFPELSRRVEEHTDYARIVLSFGDRASLTVKGLQELSLRKRDAERIVEAAQGSLGAPLDGDDLAALQSYAQRVLDLYGERERLTAYVSALAKEVAPNVTHLAGPILGAKLIDKAGSLRRMAMMPASTIQVLGAEKAMFRALKSNARPPKHGLLFQHPLVHGAPREKRGSRARALAAKLAIAARADAFSGEFIADALLSQLGEN
jgi:nucleolar protein 56